MVAYRHRSGLDGEGRSLVVSFCGYINSLHPAPSFVAIVGDLIHAYPCSEYYQKQTDVFQRYMDRLNPNIPLIILPGNHDIGNFPTQKTIDLYSSNYGQDFYSFWLGGVFFIALNTQYMMNCHEKESKEFLEQQKNIQHEWLLKQLEISKQRADHIVFLQHIPPFHDRMDEEADYFNLPPTQRLELLSAIASQKNSATHIFCGHFHKNQSISFSISDLEKKLKKDMSSIKHPDFTNPSTLPENSPPSDSPQDPKSLCRIHIHIVGSLGMPISKNQVLLFCSFLLCHLLTESLFFAVFSNHTRRSCRLSGTLYCTRV
eukprot:Sdes_comp20877_c0_seq2m17865